MSLSNVDFRFVRLSDGDVYVWANQGDAFIRDCGVNPGKPSMSLIPVIIKYLRIWVIFGVRLSNSQGAFLEDNNQRQQYLQHLLLARPHIVPSLRISSYSTR